MHKYTIWYFDDDDNLHKTNWGGNDLVKVKETVMKIRSVFKDGKRKFKKVWIAGWDCPGPLGFYPDIPEPEFEKINGNI